MTRELVTRWFGKISDAEKNLPLLLVEGFAYAPRMAYDEVNRGSALGDKLQALIESGRFGTSQLDEIAIAKVRLQQSLQNKPQDKILFATLSGKTFTPSQLLQEIEAGTEIGVQQINGEISHMRYIVNVR